MHGQRGEEQGEGGAGQQDPADRPAAPVPDIRPRTAVASDRVDLDERLQPAGHSLRVISGPYPAGDLAVIRVGYRPAWCPPRSTTQARAQVGDVVLAVGNPLGLSRSVTEGIVSASSSCATGQGRRRGGAAARGRERAASPVEFSERVDRALMAGTRDQLAATAGLEPARALFGDIYLDLRGMVVTDDMIEISAVALFGNLCTDLAEGWRSSSPDSTCPTAASCGSRPCPGVLTPRLSGSGPVGCAVTTTCGRLRMARSRRAGGACSGPGGASAGSGTTGLLSQARPAAPIAGVARCAGRADDTVRRW